MTAARLSCVVASTAEHDISADPGEFADTRWWPIDQVTHSPGTRFDPHLHRFLTKLDRAAP